MTALKSHLAKVLTKRQAAQDKHLADLHRRVSMAATQAQLDQNAAKPATMRPGSTGPNPPKG